MTRHNNHFPQNAFMTKLRPLGFDVLAALCSDLMHEVEIGVWKAIFAHAIRILETYSQAKRCDLDKR